MIKHLTQHGNSAALVIEKALLELLEIDMKTPLEVTTDGKNLVVSPVRSENREKKFRLALANVNLKHAKTLKRLAK